MVAPLTSPYLLQLCLRRMLTRKWLTNDDDFKQLRRHTERLSQDCSAMSPDVAKVRRAWRTWEESRGGGGTFQDLCPLAVSRVINERRRKPSEIKSGSELQ